MKAVLQLRKEPAYRRNAFEAGLKRLGYIISAANVTPDGPDDLLCLWNLKRGAEEKQAEEWEKRGGTVIVTENAYLQKVDKSAYAISTHGHNGSGWFPQGTEDRFSKLGFELKPWQEGDYALVCGQRSIGSRLMASPPRWAEETAKALSRKGVPTRLRLHPGNFKPKVPLTADLARAFRAHIWSSSAGVQALAEGVQVHHYAPHWICKNWDLLGREKALNHMAHGQWSVAEIESGEPFARMKAENWGPRWF